MVGYGATSKSTTTINYFGITPDLVEFISDTTPAKQGTFSPGAHIPVRPHAEFAGRYPERALLFLWNHAAEVRGKETEFARAGGKWIVYVPSVEELLRSVAVRNDRTGVKSLAASRACRVRNSVPCTKSCESHRVCR